MDEIGGIQPVESSERRTHRDDNGKGKENGIFHVLSVAAGEVIADQRHDTLSGAHHDLHHKGVKLLGNTHSRHSQSAVACGILDRAS